MLLCPVDKLFLGVLLMPESVCWVESLQKDQLEKHAGKGMKEFDSLSNSDGFLAISHLSSTSVWNTVKPRKQEHRKIRTYRLFS